MAGHKILEIIRNREALRLSSAEEVLHDGIGVVAKGNLDGSFETVNVPVVAGTLVGFMLLHQRNELLGGPSLGLEVIVVRRRSTGVHHEVDRATTSENMGAGNNRTAAVEPFRGPRVVERGRLGVELHVSWVDTRAEDPWVVEVTLSALNQEDIELVVKIGQTWRISAPDRELELAVDSRPAGTHPELPPPQTIISTSSGTVMMAFVQRTSSLGTGLEINMLLLNQERA